MKAFDLLIFDWDGTLVDSAPVIVAGMQGAIAQLGLPPRTDARIAEMIGLGIEDGLGRLYPELDPAQLLRRLSAYRGTTPGVAAAAPLFSGTLAALQGLRVQGYRLAVATGRQRHGLAAAMAQRHELAGLFEWTRCADESRDKPDPAMLFDLLAISGIDVARALMVGDTEYDVAMARAAGMEALGVASGSHDPGRLQSAGAVAVLESVAAVPDWLGLRDAP